MDNFIAVERMVLKSKNVKVKWKTVTKWETRLWEVAKNVQKLKKSDYENFLLVWMKFKWQTIKVLDLVYMKTKTTNEKENVHLITRLQKSTENPTFDVVHIPSSILPFIINT